jgi:hypothetical protein
VHIEEFLGVTVIARDLRKVGTDPEFSLEAVLASARAEADTPVQPFWPRAVAPPAEAPSRRWLAATVAMAATVLVAVGAPRAQPELTPHSGGACSSPSLGLATTVTATSLRRAHVLIEPVDDTSHHVRLIGAFEEEVSLIGIYDELRLDSQSPQRIPVLI